MSYRPIIQKTIDFIEKNLQEELSLESIAQYAGFSKYHFHRIFQREIGVTVSEYIRYRRIANSANMLLNSDRRIIDIAFYYRFETQESFTRSFKKYYELPPGQYRKIMSKLTMQREETMVEKTDPLLIGWQLSGSHPFNYQIGIDRENFHKGNASGYLKSVSTQSQEEFATMMQQFKAEKYLGKRLKLSGFIKSKNVDGFCGFWMRIDDTLGDVMQFDNMSDRPIIGDSEWNHYSIVLDVPTNSAVIAFGVLLSGSGQVWIDELKFAEVDQQTPTTNIDFSVQLLDEPVNLSFED
ncbi:helix-turn-helix transcriptional regulator [Lederbergia galactosidilytica]|uniref:Transcriptional regulator n=1 Tax=Lederbergia galactosidilytica TaxID=217031 RepID=A0A0Q9YAH4_9BACI|nr:AraC family transcriptional regulator [Lederbergia galactosidilytica]KRG12904.1 transcriptional regulator [Lederbergia galactosidilytica]MBP1916309.1 AraC-like DNA-binding protein [Lederbergia galactosidilytica]OAK70679.1 transcriptional regulator [Lederbergia galactosidilytica]